jgi:hypothetical protein
LLFKPHVGLIIFGRKTQTRRIWDRPRAKPGAVHKAKTLLYSMDYFASIRVIAVRKERLGDISLEDVRREGYESLEAFKEEWIRINRVWDHELEVYVVSFELVE